MTDSTHALKERLVTLRQTAHFLREKAAAAGGEVRLDLIDRHSLLQTRAGIAQCKADLRAQGVIVDDMPEDTATVAVTAGTEPGAGGIVQQSGGINMGIGTHIGQTGPIVAGNYIVNQAVRQPAPPMPLDQALALLATLPAGPDDPIPSPNAFQTSDVPRLMPLIPNDLFVGRDAALRDVAGRLKAGEGVVITTGMGGVGKTQLAVELAHRYGRFFGGGVFWLDASSPERLEDSIARCGLVLIRDPEFGKQPRAEQVRQVEALWADALPRLLIFDNGDDPALVGWHRPPAGGCRVLVTSRTRRWPAGERLVECPLDVLERVQSVALLRALAPRLSEGEAGGVAEELGDLPLALHLAGSFLARSPSVDPAEFCERVRARTTSHPALKGHGDASAPTYRQQQRESSLEAVFQISLERLDPHYPIDTLARTLLARAAGLREPGWPFPRPFLVDTAPQQEAADPDLPPPAEEAVERLLQLGLLEAEGAGRLRLHRLLAGFAWTALDGPGVFAAFAPAALQWVAVLIGGATDLWPARDVEGRRLLDHERLLWEQFLDWGYAHEQGDGTCASARATASLGNYWVLSGTQGQEVTRTRLQHALAAAQRNGDTAAEANVLQAIGDVQQFQKDMPAAQASYAAALELFRAVGDRLGEANTRKAIGDVQQFQKDMPAAQASYAAALELYRAVGERVGEANTLRAIGDVQQFQKDMPAAQASYAAALELFRAVGDRLGEANTRKAIGDVQQFQKDMPAAQASYAAALELYRAVGERVGEANTLLAIGDVQQFQDELPAAQASYAAALELFRAVGDRLGEANTLQAIGDVQRFRKELEAAQGSYAAALELFRAVGSRLGEANTLRAIGDVQQFQGEREAAQASYAAALELYRAVGSRLGEANTLLAIGDVQQFQDELPAAQASYAAALELFRAVGSRLGEANVLSAQSWLWLDTDPARSEETLEAVLAVRQALGDSYGEGADLGNYAVALLQRGRPEEALPYLQRARAIFAARGLDTQVQQTDQLIAQAQAAPLTEQLAPLLHAVAAVARGDEGLRAQVEDALAQLEHRGFHLTTAVQAIWTGQRDPALLTAGLDDTHTELIRRILALLDEAETAQNEQHNILLARAQAAVAAAGPDPAARAALADRLHTAAAAYTSDTPAERALAAQLRALAAQLGGEAD